MRTPSILSLVALLPLIASAQPAPQVVQLWEGGAPGFESRKDEPVPWWATRRWLECKVIASVQSR
ncbi:MAG TPA: hypothetical protein VIK52_09950 [Opitutaceae bacterium]